MKQAKPNQSRRWRRVISSAACVGVALAGLPAFGEVKATPKDWAVEIDPTVRLDVTKGLRNADRSWSGYVNPYARIKIESPFGVAIVTDIDLRRLTSGNTLRTDEVPHMIHRALLVANVMNGELSAGVSRVPFGPDENSDYDGRTIFGANQDKLTNMDERFLASYKITLDNGISITGTFFSSEASGKTSNGNQIRTTDLMDPKFGNSGDLSGALKVGSDLEKLVTGLKANVSWAYVRQDDADDHHRIAAGLEYVRDFGKVATTLVAQYARILVDNAKDLDSFLAYGRANLKGQPWGVYFQYDRTDDATLGGEPVNTVEAGLDYTKSLGAMNLKLLGGVYVRDSKTMPSEVGIGTSAILNFAKPLRYAKSE